MTRPQIIRADTLDLQDHDTPSAKDHSRQPEHPTPLGGGRPAPHQELSIRHADKDSKSAIRGGPGSDSGVDMYGEPEDMDDDLEGTQYEHEDGDLADGESDDLLDDDLMDKISSSPSIDDEDIDFEFVYALHNFVATVDGQANAAKGDTMVLLDDSNSYWWLVRVVKDGSIGYLPAEHIETPTERLARLNKHRNVDLSATMLGDNSEKSKNPLKKAMRRRNAKTVNFTAPTYIEASDVEFSSDDDSEHGDFFNDDETVDGEEEESQEANEDIVVEPLRPKAQKDKPVEQTESNGLQEIQEPEHLNSEPRRSSEEFFDPEEPSVSRSRNGTVRNTDSFFKDDTAEPKKISLTPNLLREEQGGNLLTEVKEERGSFETIDKASIPQEKAKEDKKRKDKKPGMLSGLFKRKDKKSKATDDDFEEPEKSPAESTFRASPQPKTSMDSLDSRSSKPQRQPSNKLQKQPPMSPTKVDPQVDPAIAQPAKDTEVMHRSQSDQSIRQVTAQGSNKPKRDFRYSCRVKGFIGVPGRATIERSAVERGLRFLCAHHACTAFCGISAPEIYPQANNQPPPPESESPVNVSPVGAPGLTMDASPRARSVSPISPPSSPEVEQAMLKGNEATPGSVDTPTWSDASLRSYLDEENDIRDLFMIVHDKSNVPPAGPDHPITGRLFKEESKRLKEMTNQLDEMLVGWVSQRARQSTPMRTLQSPST
ncbi:hypothetical protein NUU61_006497 [Penicillium alfredii]|uniref:SH3 domain-containing protein n=1 Tax=Penicillium alfredii TaxID=1506179 RepID=A0A9W9F107_9EURO|nr:uncharacterized protein NUU61_006497 [Penicillium alfredii]KAJ5091627.1 hypothetical protein NUU61_006497 [Penicillium alfredii]